MVQNMQIEAILRHFYTISGFRVSIYDTEYHEIYAYPKTKCTYCTALQKNKDVLKRCIKSDKEALEKAAQSGKNYTYICPNQLYEMVQPIYNYGVLSGYLLMGQVAVDYPEKRTQLIAYAQSILKDKQHAENLLDTLTFLPPQKLESYVGIMSILAAYITENHMLCHSHTAMPILIKEFLDANYGSKITIDYLAQKFECSRSSVQKGFVANYGCSVMQYLQTVRLEKAKELLEKSKKTIAEVASICGYADQNYFSRIFNRAMGCSPKAYRMQKQ